VSDCTVNADQRLTWNRSANVAKCVRADFPSRAIVQEVAPMNSFREAEAYCLARSWRLRLRPADTRYLVAVAVNQLPPKPPHDFAGHKREWKARLTDSLDRAVRQRYGNPVVVWVLLNVVVPIVVNLVMDWWRNREDA
jgi:hypothetical protein